ncbi:mannose-binding protein A-like [Magallana gigas]|uniref:mannose-binding protein A-like n=1 Tax=Magallana gigas TaxID=29159 RepID=UPI003342BBE1
MSMCSKLPDSSSFFYNNGMKTCFCTGTVNGVDLVQSDGFRYFSSKRETLNWITFGRSVYLQLNTRMKLGDAQVECMKIGAKVAEIDSAEENSFLKEMAINISGDVLIGATDVFKEGSWVHLSSWREITFSDWGPDQPDNHFSSSEHCLVLKSGHGFGYQWNDVVCNFEAYVVCEQKLG